MLLVSTSAFAGEPPFPAPRPAQKPVEVEQVDEDALKEEIREDLREEMQDEIDAEVQRQLDAQRAEEAGMDEDVIVVNPPDIDVAEVEQVYQHNITAGAGALGFIGDDLDFQDASGPAWNLRYGYNLPLVMDNLLTWEVAYTGATDMDDGDVEMTATMFETDLKVNTIPGSVVYPIFTAGLGYGAFTRDLDNGNDLEDLGTLTVPLSAGVEVALDNILFDARATYRPVFFDEDELQFTEIGMDNWAITADIGTRF
jgi:hypothetical protein